MRLYTVPALGGSYRLLGRVTGTELGFLGERGVPISEIVQRAENRLVEAAAQIGAYVVLDVTYSMTSYVYGDTPYVAVLVAGTAITEPQD